VGTVGTVDRRPDLLTYYCWHCYGTNREASGACRECGQEIGAPAGTTFDDRLLWALGHPLAERRMAAALALGKRRLARASGPLRDLVDDPDPYLAAVALEALVEIDGAETHDALLAELRGSAPPAVRAVARRVSSSTPAPARRSGG
jgi:HEAT repeats